jgi:hypothetical protein
MYLWQKFSRVTAASTPWTVDALPVDSVGNQAPPGPGQPFAISVTTRDNNGIPPHRLAIAYHGPTTAPALTATLYVWDANTQRYYAVSTAFTLTAEAITFVSIMTIANPPPSSANMDQGMAGGASFVLIVNPTAATTNGTYTFAMGPDLVTN